jgi:hypothetical protein
VAGGAATGLGSLDIATVNGVSKMNSTVEADVTANPAGGFAGFVSRYSGPGDQNMYWAGLSTFPVFGNTQAQIWVNVGGNWIKLAGVSVASGAGKLKLVTNGNTLSLYLNNVLTLQVTDNTLTGPGTVGIRGSAGATFANFMASSP